MIQSAPTAAAPSTSEGDATMMRRRSNAQASARAFQLLIDQVLLVVEEATEAGESCLQDCGKAAFRHGLETEPEVTYVGAAQRLFEAVTGYVWRAWRTAEPDPAPARIAAFRRRVLEGLDQGAGETRRLLQLMGRRTIITDHALLRAQDTFRLKLERWLLTRQAELPPVDPEAGRE